MSLLYLFYLVKAIRWKEADHQGDSLTGLNLMCKTNEKRANVVREI